MIFNNRELAFITWIIVAFLGFLFFGPFRKFIQDIVKLIFTKAFLIIYFLLAIYLGLILVVLKRIHLWDYYLIKDTMFWLIGVGFVLTLSGIGKEVSFFRRTAIESIKLTIIVEFIINLHVFNYFIEVLILPLLVFFFVIQGVAESDDKYLITQNFFNYLLGIIGFGLFTFGVYQTILNFKEDFTYENFQSILLPSILTLLFIPFSYLIAVYSAYESLFFRYKYYKSKKWNHRKIKFEILYLTRFNISKIVRLKSKLNIFEIDETDNLRMYIRSLVN